MNLVLEKLEKNQMKLNYEIIQNILVELKTDYPEMLYSEKTLIFYHLLSTYGTIIEKNFDPNLIISKIEKINSKSIVDQPIPTETDIDAYIYEMTVPWYDPSSSIENDWDKRVEWLFSLPQPEQRSKAWFDMRKLMITASDIGIVTGDNHNSSLKELYQKKCGYGKPFTGNIFTEHGVQFEQVATDIYAARSGVEVIEFGLIQHPHLSFIGASPDGIIRRPKDSPPHAPPTGTMLEIKCPYKRKIILDDGSVNIPAYYYAQMQVQMEVTGLRRCDFEQCDLKEYNSYFEFVNDSHDDKLGFTQTGMEKGCLVRFTSIEDNGTSNHYEYCPIHTGNEECKEWADNMILTRPGDHSRVIYWWLKQYSVVPVERNKEWFCTNLPGIDRFWKQVLFYRSNPEKAKEDLEPKRKKKEPKGVTFTNCVLDSDSDSDSD